MNEEEHLVEFRELLARSQHVVIITAAGLSCESGIPKLNGEEVHTTWRDRKISSLTNWDAFDKDPALVWEYYQFARDLVQSKNPNEGHYAIAKFEQTFSHGELKTVTIVTQNTDELHQRAGSRNVIELHGSLYRTQCTSCWSVFDNLRHNPICPAFEGRGGNYTVENETAIAMSRLPHCLNKTCNGLLRPYVVWNGQMVHDTPHYDAKMALKSADLAIVVDMNSVIHPAVDFISDLVDRDIPIAEFQTESVFADDEYIEPRQFKFQFAPPCKLTLPEALKPVESDNS